MQTLNLKIIKLAKAVKLKMLEDTLRDYVSGCQVGELITCPFCHYIGKNKRGTAKVFPNNTFKCFACGEWRMLG